MFERHGISFLTGNVVDAEMRALIAPGRILSHQRASELSADIYANGMNYTWYGDATTYDPLRPTEVTSEAGWSLQKLQSQHSQFYYGDPTKGNRVFGVPIMAINTSILEETASLQVGHTNSSTIEHISNDLVAHTARFRIIGGNLGIIGGGFNPSLLLGKLMTFAYYDFSLGIDPILGLASPDTDMEISGKTTEITGTVTALATDQSLVEFDVHMSTSFTLEQIRAIIYMAPDNQTLTVLPLGHGEVTDLATGQVAEVSMDTFGAIPSQMGVPGWSYIQDAAAMSEPRVCASPVLNVVLQPNQLVRFMAIGCRHKELSDFTHGLTVGIL